MCALKFPKPRPTKGMIGAFALTEVVVCIAFVAMLFGGIIGAYIQAGYRAEWSGYSLAAQALATQQLEQAKAAIWDNQTTPPKNEITGIPTMTVATLDLPVSGTNVVYATNYATVTPINDPNTGQVLVYMVRVDTVWPFLRKNTMILYTNTLANYYAPD